LPPANQASQIQYVHELILKDASENLLVLYCDSNNAGGPPLAEPKCRVSIVDNKTAKEAGWLQGDKSAINSPELMKVIEKNRQAK